MLDVVSCIVKCFAMYFISYLCENGKNLLTRVNSLNNNVFSEIVLDILNRNIKNFVVMVKCICYKILSVNISHATPRCFTIDDQNSINLHFFHYIPSFSLHVI